jgi:hypothetical protein
VPSPPPARQCRLGDKTKGKHDLQEKQLKGGKPGKDKPQQNKLYKHDDIFCFILSGSPFFGPEPLNSYNLGLVSLIG